MIEKANYALNILIVSVDPGISNIIEFLLNKLNYKIQLTNNGKEAIEQLKEKNYDFILLDVDLPDMNVLQVMNFSMNYTPNTMIIILTGEDSIEKTIQCYKHGAHDFITKSFNKDEIPKRFENALIQKRLLKELEINQDRLEKSERRYQCLVQNSMDVIYNLDSEGVFTFVNDSLKILGYDQEHLIGKHYSTIIYPEDLEKAKYTFFERRTSNRESKSIHLRLKVNNENFSHTKRREKYITIELKAKGFYDRLIDDKDKIFLGTYGIARNISKQIRTEESLKLQKAFFKQLFNNSPEAILILDNQNKIVDANRSFENLFKYSSDEVKNKYICDPIVPDDLKDEAKSLSRTILSEGVAKKESVRKCKDGQLINVSIFACPIMVNSKKVGNYCIYRDIEELMQSEKELEKALDRLRKAMGGVIHAMVSTVEVRDPYTAGHQQRVANLARALAQEIGLNSDEIDGIRMAGTIHDLGKVNIPAEILSKPGRLTEIEFNLIKMHPKIAYEILKEIDFPWPVADIVYQHHERIDGSGYPQGLKDEDIHLAGKILTVADVVEAISSHRPYRPALGIDKAIEEISKYRGVYYDPIVVDACCILFKEKMFSFVNGIKNGNMLSTEHYKEKGDSKLQWNG
ncbi:MAG: PAS domain S-box protein [Spirochaetota bacterium]|nr:PAS domain S-box protein [Spirochaetota bacterium]